MSLGSILSQIGQVVLPVAGGIVGTVALPGLGSAAGAAIGSVASSGLNALLGGSAKPVSSTPTASTVIQPKPNTTIQPVGITTKPGVAAAASTGLWDSVKKFLFSIPGYILEGVIGIGIILLIVFRGRKHRRR